MIEVNRKQLTRALDLVSAVVSSRSTIPILASVKVTANGSLRIEGSNLDNCTCAELPYEGDSGEFLLPQPRMIRAAINQTGGEAVALTPGENVSVRLRSGRLDSTLNSLPAYDFPSIDRIGFEEFSATLGAGELRQVARIMPAISSEETRYYLNGVCVTHLGDWTYRFAATNGHLLMMVDVPLPDATGTIPDKTIIPREWLNIVMSRLARAKEGARLSYGRMAIPNTKGLDLPLEPGGARIALGAMLDGLSFSVTGKLIDGQYPDYDKVVPQDLRHFARVGRGDLVQAIQALSAVRFGKTSAIKLTFPKGKICCELNCPELGKSIFDCDAEHDLPTDFHIGLNGGYLLSMLAALTGEEVTLQMSDPMAPLVITDPADTAFKGVIMPMRG